MTDAPQSSRSTAPSRRMRGVAAGFVTGWALGLLETGMALSASGQYVKSIVDGSVGLAAPACVYGAGGAVIGLVLLDRARAWTLLYVLGAAWLVRARFERVGDFHWSYAVLGALASLTLWWWSRRGALERTVLVSRLGVATLCVPFVLLGALALAGDDDEIAPPPRKTSLRADLPNVVLVTWDTVRGDSLPILGGEGLDTPALDALAREGVVFENAQAVAPITAPAHASILSGLYPFAHGLRSNGDAAPPHPIPRLPEVLARAGYATGGFVSNFSLRGRYGFDRGLDAFVDRPAQSALPRLIGLARLGCVFLRRVLPSSFAASAFQTPGDATLARALQWYGATEGPAFLWTHFYDAHFPYEPREPHRARVLARQHEGARAVVPESQDFLVMQRGEIEWLDALLARLRVSLEEKDPGLANTLIVVIADHGECFGEGGILHGHHKSLFAATQHIGFVVRGPSVPAGLRVAEAVSQVDVLPTVCALVGLPAPPGLQGRSLVPLVRGESGAPRGLYMEAFQADLGDERMEGWWRDGFKYVRNRAGSEVLYASAGARELDVTGAQPERLARLRAELDHFLAGEPHQVASDQALSPQERKALEALGYTGE